jgi:hypothetical protein
MHPRICELREYLDQQRALLQAAVEAVPSGRRNEAPEPGRWSTANVLEHLAVVEDGIAKRLARRIAEARVEGLGPETHHEPVLPTLSLRHLRDRTTRLAAPEAVAPTGLGAEAAWLALEQAGSAVRQALATGDGLALGTVFLPHPRFGQMSVYYFFAFVGAHEARHAAQIREIAEAFASIYGEA